MYIPFTFETISNYSFNGTIQYLLVGGGGAGNYGGGGAGGFVTGSCTLLGNTTYPIFVGNGGEFVGQMGTSGQYTYAFNITSSGGGGGGLDGASGGGANPGAIDVNVPGGTGIPGQGNNGGIAKAYSNGAIAAGGGGGAGQVGGDATGLLTFYSCGNGGDGKVWFDSNYYAGGGGGCDRGPFGTHGCVGGNGGGGQGGYPGTLPTPIINGTPGADGTGGGGGGRYVGFVAAGDGGSGITKIRYPGSQKAYGGTITFDGTYTYHSFSGAGQYYLTTFNYNIPPFPEPVIPNKVFYNVTQCNETSSFNIDINTLFTPNTPIYNSGSVLYLTGSISGCFGVNSFLISSSLSGSTIGVQIANSFGSCNTCLSGYPQFPISSSLVIWNAKTGLTGSTWYDYSGNGNNALVSGSTLSLSGSLGYAFNGTNNYLTYPLSLVAEPSYSYTLQYYGSLPSETTNRDFFVKGYYNDGWDTLYRGSDTKDFVYRGDAGFDKVSPAITPIYAEKHLITIRVNSTTNLMDLYVNNTSLGDFSRIGYINEFNTGSLPLVFGWNIDGDGTYWKGAVSDLLVFNKELSATEISQSYAYLSSL